MGKCVKVISNMNTVVRRHKEVNICKFPLVSRYIQFETLIYAKTKSGESFFVVIESGPCLAMEGEELGVDVWGPGRGQPWESRDT